MNEKQIEYLIEKLAKKEPKIRSNETQAYKKAVMRMTLEAAFAEVEN